MTNFAYQKKVKENTPPQQKSNYEHFKRLKNWKMSLIRHLIIMCVGNVRNELSANPAEMNSR